MDERHHCEVEIRDGIVRVIGVYAAGGTASFDWFDYEVLPG